MYSHDKYKYASDSDLNADIIELPYQGKNFSMVILLPQERSALQGLVRSLSASRVQSALSALTEHELELTVPKLKLETKLSLVQPLSNLGADSIFGPKANLSGISAANDLYVSDVLHKAVIEVNEEGSEASAFTGVGGATLGFPAQRPPPVEVNVDHPFLFCVRHVKTNLILFLGVVNAM
uniref:Secreted salivary gland n=1 Tax=Alectorobius mimon TaxID=360319 RepID=A0A147B7F9_9ACAR